MQSVMVAGAGKIGSTIAQYLSFSGHYRVHLVDVNTDSAHPHATHAPSEHLQLQPLDTTDLAKASQFIQQHQIEAVVTALPYTCNQAMLELAIQNDVHYFDLSEDVASMQRIIETAKHSKKAFVPQCGLAPGFVNIVAADLLQYSDQIRSVKIRCGALPQDATNALQYALTWSTDGLINEYGNTCYGMLNGQRVPLYPLGDLETIVIDGIMYEAFNTSGGVGTLFETYGDQAESITYKTMRYPGHCKKMRFLMNDLRLNDDRDTLKRIMENAIPTTQQDVVIVHVTVDGKFGGQLNHRAYTKKFYPKKIAGIECTAIQATTASGACAAIDTVLSEPEKYQGFIKQEQFSLPGILQNHFGTYLADD